MHSEDVEFDNVVSHETQMPAKIRQKSKHKASAKNLCAEQKGWNNNVNNQNNDKDDQNHKPSSCNSINREFQDQEYWSP